MDVPERRNFYETQVFDPICGNALGRDDPLCNRPCLCTVSIGEAVEALYTLDGEQPMIEEIHNDEDEVYATYEKNAASWAYAYNILSEDDDMDADITRAELAEILYHYAKHNDVDISANGQLASRSKMKDSSI